MKCTLYKIFFFIILFGCNYNVFAQADAVSDEIIVMFNKPININEWLGINDRSNNVKSLLKTKKFLAPQMNTYLFQAENANLDFVIKELLKLPEIQYAQKNHFLQQRDVISNDTFLNKQWQWINNGSITGSTADADVDAEKAWDITTGGLTSSGDTIVVAVVDDGANLSHPDLKENYWKNYNEIPGNGIDDDGNGYIDDYNGWNTVSDNDNVGSGSHGVSVAGMIGAKGNNKLGVTGINWNVKILQVKYNSSLTESNVIESYSYVLKQRTLYNETNGQKGAFVVACNSSWGIDKGKPENSPIWCAFYDTMGVHGILSVGATANQNYNIDVDGDLPTACSSEYLIAVTSSTYADKKATAGYGKVTIDVASPGNQIYTTSSASYTNTSGTSFATPLVSGLVGLLYSAPCRNLPTLYKKSPLDAAKYVRDAIFNGIDVLPAFKDLTKYGGRVNAFNSLLSLLSNCGSCPKPVGYNVSNILDTSATINWVSLGQNQTFDIVYKPATRSNWDTIRNVSLPLNLNKLLPCTNYEYKIFTLCTDTILGFGALRTFKTDGCCLAPTNLSAVIRNDSTALFIWDKVLASKNYEIKVKNLATGEVIVKNVNSTNLQISNLKPCSSYEYTVGSACNDSTLVISETKTFNTTGCGACTDLTYCTNNGGATNLEYIESVELNTLKNISGDNGGYSYFADKTTDLNWLYKYNLILTPGFSQSTSNEVFKAWIDYNQDGAFSKDEIIITPKQTKVPITYEFYVPKTAKPGITRLRIQMRYSSDTTFDACQAFNYGEVEDYCVNIVPVVICQPIKNLKVEKTVQNKDYLSWDNEITADNYIIEYKKISETNWTMVNGGNINNYTFTGLDTCTDYNVRVYSNCNGTITNYSEEVSFKTLCTNNVSDLDKDRVELLVSPNPFENDFQVILNNWNNDWKFLMYDITGKKLIEQKYSQTTKNVSINAAEFASGVYLCKVILGNNVITNRIVKE